MPNRIWVRPALPEESKTFIDWSLENADKSQFDPAVAAFPSSVTWVAYDKDGPLVYQTIQQPLMLESIAPRPGVTPIQISSALKELTQNAVSQAHILGAGEILFFGSDADTDRFATNHIFEEVPMKIFRVKIRDLEGLNETNH